MHKHTATAVAPQATLAVPPVNEKRGLRGVHCRVVKECEYVYRDSRGKDIFVKVRYRWIHTATCDGSGSCRGRDKTFAYYYRSASGRLIKQKPPDANSLLYRMEEIEPALAKGTAAPIYWTEGERDVESIRVVGGIATTAHQGAGKVTLQQAQCLYHASRSYNATWIILVADRDEAGAYDAVLRTSLLLEAGFTGRLDIVRAAAGKDAADHLSAGHALAEFVHVHYERLKEAADRYKSDLEANTARYLGEER